MILHVKIKSLKQITRGFLGLLILFSSFTASAQQKVLKFDNYTKDNGLLHSYILDIFQDSEGYIWASSYGGLNRFDGTSFTGYNDRTEVKTPTNVVHSIMEPASSQGKILWFGTENGVMKLDKPSMTFKHYAYESTAVLSMSEGKDGILWLGTAHKGLVKFDSKSGKFETTPLKPNGSDTWGDRINTIFKDNSGNLWIGGTNTGLIRFDPGNNTFERFLNTASGAEAQKNSINCIYEYQKKLMVGTWGAGIFLFDRGSHAFEAVSPASSDLVPIYPIITGIAPDHEGDLWFSTLGGGLYEVQLAENNGATTMTSVEQYTKNNCGSNSIANNIIEVLYKDQTGNFWIGTLGGGLSKLDFYNHKFDHYQILQEGFDRLDQRSVLSVGQTKEGAIWYGTQADGVYTYSSDLKPLSHITLTTDNNSSNVVRQIYADSKNRMWLGVDGGLFLLSADGKKKKYFDLSPYGISQGSIHAICVDAQDRLWFGVYEYGVYRMQLPEDPFRITGKPELTHYTSGLSNGNLSSNLIWAIYEDREDQLWVGTDKGLDLYNAENDRFKKVLDRNVSCIMESDKVKSNKLWVGTYGSGLYLMNKVDYAKINFSTENGLSNNNINGILEDVNGHIWAGTEKGICAIDPSGLYNGDLASMTDKQVNSSRVKSYLLHDGLQGHEFHLNANQVLKDGRLLFGGPKGFNIFDPQNILVNTFVFPVKINDFKIHNSSIRYDSSFTKVPEHMDSICLTYEQNYFTVEFSQISLSTPERATYQYMLEGYDNDWITTDAFHRRITYTGIPEGDYLLKIKAINPDGFVSSEVTKLAIHIDPPWYRTMWFLTLVVFFIIGLLSFTYFTLSRRSKRRHRAALNLQQETFQKEKLQVDLEYKNKELTASAMYMVNRNEKLKEIQDLVEDAMRKMGSKNSPEMNKILDMIDNVLKDKDNWENFEKNFNLIDSNFTKRLMDVYPALSNNDVKICTYMRMNLSSKEIAGLLNIAPKSLETSRLRIRKKMELESSVYLSDFILKF